MKNSNQHPNFDARIVEVDGVKAEIYAGKSGNIFEDMGFENAAEMTLKADLALEIRRIVHERGLTQRAAAALVGLKGPDVSNIVNARLDGISVERLLSVLNRFGRDIEIRISSEEREGARTLVLA